MINTDFKIAINKFSLTFNDKGLEKEFRDRSIESVRKIIRIAIIFGSTLFIISNFVVRPDASIQESFFNKFLTPSIGIGFLILTYLKQYRKYYLAAIALTFIVGGYTAVYSSINNHDFMMFLYLRILFFTLIPFFTFRLLLVSNVLLILGVFLIYYFFSQENIDIVLNHTLKLLPFIIISLLAFYIKQRFERLSFLKTKEIKERNNILKEGRKSLENQAVLASVLQNSTKSSLNIKFFLQESLEIILDLPWLNILSKGSIFITNTDGNLEMIAQKDLGVLTKTCALIKPGQCLCGKALSQKKLLFNSCVTADHDIRPEGMTPHGHFNVPLMLNNEVLGVLNVYVDHDHVKTKDEVGFFELIANTLASVIYRNKLEKEREEQAQNLKRYFKAIEQSETTILFTDTEGVINYVNPHITKVTGYSQEELIGNKAGMMNSGETAKEVFEDMWKTIRHKKTWTGEFINQKKDGTNFIEKAIISPVVDKDGEIVEFIAIKEDITEQKKVAKQIIDQKEMIELAHEKIQSSIEYAQRIQNSLLASSASINEKFDDLIISFLPKETVSGDFYIGKQKNNLTYIAVADCTGHGVPGAIVSALAIQELSHIIDSCICTAGEMLNILNTNINNLLNNDDQIGSDGLDLILLCIDTENKTINYAGAKGLFYLHQADELVRLKTDRASIGQIMRDEKFSFETKNIAYKQNDTVFLLTDGLIDQLSIVDKKRVGSKRTKQCFEKMITLDVNEKQAHLNQFINTHKSVNQTDDITLISFKL